MESFTPPSLSRSATGHTSEGGGDVTTPPVMSTISTAPTSPSPSSANLSLKAAAPVVVLKVGSSSIVDEETDLLALSRVASIVEHIVAMRRAGYKVILVTSGAVGIGLRRLGIKRKPTALVEKQAAAAVGQGRLMRVYDDLFSQLNTIIAQVLLTKSDLGHRAHYLNACSTLKQLLDIDVLPIVNENDAVSATQEIRFGDNDALAALVAGMVDAQWLFLLTDVDALYTSNPRTDPDAKAIHVIEDVDKLKDLGVDAHGEGSSMGTGGMQTKLIAASLATAAGVNMVITKSDHPERIIKIIQGDEYGTVFKRKDVPLDDRKWWIRHGLHVFGKLTIDDGAVETVRRNNSLFTVGIMSVSGTFTAHQAVALISASTGEEVARGLVNYTNIEIGHIKGKHSSDIPGILGYIDAECVIFRQNLVLT